MAINFEQSLEKLNQLVSKMEQGNLPLEQSLEAFEEGVLLIKDCQKALQKAQQKVQILTAQENAELEPFNPNDK